MLAKRSQHLIRKFSELLVFTDGAATALLDTIGSPRSPFEMMMNSKMQSPKGLKSYEFGGVGLGIVVALDKSEESGYEVVPKHVCTSNLNRSGPIQVQTIKKEFVNEFLVGSPEDYTFVTYHEPNKTITKVYYDSGEDEILKHGFATKKNNNVGVFRRNSSLPTQTLVQAESSYPTLDFLSSCHLCNKKLDGIDIYIYRGEKAFCSSDCRSKQIMMDERKEQCRSEASKSVEMSSSPYTTRDQMFSTGIIAL